MEKKKISEQEYADLIVVAYQVGVKDPAIKSKLEALMLLVCSIENSLADYNNGISSLFEQIEKNFE